ncbi:hypothetical protein SAMN05421856_1191 [Chryseobacterium taichungense]|uniref:DUF6896 domain-containing protein n=1 Tax=Chryseobacterium taichungense TaxID=295069 RepID=A0A1H8DWF4_9FLAO|nr:hypothetical protein [Chryseobacterium taichungense]SEN11505.1 hypothetical protein SAMN05421856_1191 [Chryseobacterium taichungense]
MNTNKILIEYIDFIKDFEDTIKREKNISNNENIWSYMVSNLIDKENINSYKFIRHGSGFTVEKNAVVCEYDKAPLNEYDIKFSFWKFKNFIESSYKEIVVDQIALKNDLSHMIEKGILHWLIIDDINWNIYQTNFRS